MNKTIIFVKVLIITMTLNAWPQNGGDTFMSRFLILENQVEDLDNTLAQNQETIDTLENENESLRSDLAQLQETNTSLQSQIETLQDKQSQIPPELKSTLESIEGYQNRIHALENKTFYMSLSKGKINGVTGPHVIFEGANLHIRSGGGQTADNESNLGNLIIGYNEPILDTANIPEAPRNVDLDPSKSRSGSHNLIVGPHHQFFSYGGFVAGNENVIFGEYSSILSGQQNFVTGYTSSVSGGTDNKSTDRNASISGGTANEASGSNSTVNGGIGNRATALYSSVSGGLGNRADGDASSVSGGTGNKASGSNSSISGGENNIASGEETSISGGLGNEASGNHSSVSGGNSNEASGIHASVSGGSFNIAQEANSSVSGGITNKALAVNSSISGGNSNESSGKYASVSGGQSNEARGEASSVSGGRGNFADQSSASVSGGISNRAVAINASISGGQGNEASGESSSVSGGYKNSAIALRSNISGGQGNEASGEASSISGGGGNIASGLRSSVSGGGVNEASGTQSSVSGGNSNIANAHSSSVNGGNSNVASGKNSSISGGNSNKANGGASSVSGGAFNQARGIASNVSGGYENEAVEIYSSVNGGISNQANGMHSSVSGGEANEANGENASVSGGYQNIASGLRSSVSGGNSNIASGRNSTVRGGNSNEASGGASSVSGGYQNQATALRASVSGGNSNEAIGNQSSISGGHSNISSGGASHVSGGKNNITFGFQSSIAGGLNNNATGGLTFIGGGEGNNAFGTRTSILGGLRNETYANWSSVSGGRENKANANNASINGGFRNQADGRVSSILGGREQATNNDLEMKTIRGWDNIVPHFEYVNENINGLSGPHLFIEGVNLHLRSGSGSSVDDTGLGNLIVGYNEGDTQEIKDFRFASHDIIVGPYHKYGRDNMIKAAKIVEDDIKPTPTPTNTLTPTPQRPTPRENLIAYIPNLPNNARPLELVEIPSGSFDMGSSSSRAEDEKPVHIVEITKDFHMSKYEITNAQYHAVMNTENQNNLDKPDHPVVSVSWQDCQEFIQRLNTISNGDYRLPTEAEWEYACRAGTQSVYYWQNRNANNFSWNRSNSSGQSHPVGFKEPNAWGLFDMSGNVMEWCQDWYSPSFYENSPTQNPINDTRSSNLRVTRGGGWNSYPANFRSASRGGSPFSRVRSDLGFRIVSDSQPIPEAKYTPAWTHTPTPTHTPTTTPTPNPNPNPTIVVPLDDLPGNAVPLEMVKIPAGSFTMGSHDSRDSYDTDMFEFPRHNVNITKDFYIGKYEITVDQFLAVMPSYDRELITKGGDYPMTQISWEQWQNFIQNLNAKGVGTYRMPTEAEWEYACRAGTIGTYYWGYDDSHIDDFEWYEGNSSDDIQIVGQKNTNPWGLHDMCGNVTEWCADWWTDNYAFYVIHEIFDDPFVTYEYTSDFDIWNYFNENQRVVRGGNVNSNVSQCRVSTRFYHESDIIYQSSHAVYPVGLRIIRTE